MISAPSTSGKSTLEGVCYILPDHKGHEPLV